MAPPGAARPEALPPRLLPVLYLGAAHFFLAAGFAVVALDPAPVAGFFYQPRTVAIVHLITLGWISASILGALYMIGPIALRLPMPSRAVDHVAFGLFAIGAIGMVGHFFVAEYPGVAWAAGMVVLGVLGVGARVLGGLRSAPIQPAVRLHIILAFLNFLLAAGVGILLALDKRDHFLPGLALPNVYAHAHLAALGWASMMVMGAGYRLLPMVLPAEMPRGPGLYASAALLEAGALGTAAALLTRSAWLPLSALAAAGGFGAFFRQVAWMRRRPRKPPAGMPLPDYGVRHALQAFGYAALSAILGLVLSLAPTSDATLRAAAAYGVFGLVGFLAQIVVGMEARLLPMFASYHSNLNLVYDRPAPKAHELPNRRLQAAGFWLWTTGVPALAAGLVFEVAPVVATGASILFLAVVLGAINAVIVARHADRTTWDRGRGGGAAFDEWPV